MRAGHRGAWLVFGLLLLGSGAVVAQIAKVARYTGLRAEWRAQKIASIAGPVRSRLQSLDGEVLLSYYVSPREEMPAELARLEDEVVLILDALARASLGRVSYQVVDPTTSAELAAWLEALELEPTRARRVERDGFVEQDVWSSLHIAYGGREGAAIRALGPEHIPHLQSLILAHLDQLEHPEPPRVVLLAPQGYERLPALLSGATVADSAIDTDLDNADLLVWIEPEDVSAEELVRVRAFTDAGGSLIVAGSPLAARAEGNSVSFEAAPETPGNPGTYGALFAAYGLRHADGLLFDTFCAELEGTSSPAPYRLRCVATNQDFRSMRGQPNGTLLFDTPRPFELDAARLRALGRHAEVFATSSEQSWTRNVPEDAISIAELIERPPSDLGAAGLGVKRALGVRLVSDDPAAGEVVFLASASPFADEHIDDPAYAHTALLAVLESNLASPQRLALKRSSLTKTARVAEIAPRARVLWRAVTSLLVPGIIAGLALARSARRRARSHEAGGARTRGLMLRAALGVALVLVVGAFLPRVGVDLTGQGALGISKESRERIGSLAETGELSLELAFTKASRLPPELRPQVRRAREMARELGGWGVGVRELDVEQADPEALGIQAVTLSSVFDEVTTVRRVTSAIRVIGPRGTEVLPLASERSFENLEFRIVSALTRVAHGTPRPHVAVACDIPRMSPAEALEEYQKKGLFAPTGSDVYTAARRALARNEFRVTFVDPDAPRVPEDVELLVWFGPRRDARPMLEIASAYLGSGGTVMIAAQHFDVVKKDLGDEPQQSPWWPQPWFPDLDRHYLPDVGIELVREVLFDELTSTQEGTSAPFLLRAAGSSFASDTMLDGIADLSFPSGNRIRWDRVLLAQNGIKAEPLVFTSQRAWVYTWDGGALPAEALEPGQVKLTERGVLAARFKGRFPAFDADTGTGLPLDASATTPGELILFGSSKMFDDEHLDAHGFRHDHLLLNIAARKTSAAPLARLLLRRPEAGIARGFDYVDPEVRLAWRAFALGISPLLLAAFGIGWRLVRGRAKGSFSA